MRFAHTNIISKDWKRLADFYVNVFNCSIVPPVRDMEGDWLDKGLGIENSKLEGAHLRLPGHGSDGPTLEIFQYSEIHDQRELPPNIRGFGHIAFEVEDVSKMVEIVLKHGGTKLGEITTRDVPEAGFLTFTYMRDPDGNIVELQSWE